ncbi:MAG: DNA-binding protein, partial [Acinetobacter sp.]|nr:DNA-binding protein [Acinetobacter sp.]
FYYTFIQSYSGFIKMIKTLRDVKDEFSKSGISVAQWARENNFSPDLVYQILHRKRLPLRGESHKIAVKLGLKDGIIEPDFTFEKIKEEK